MGIYKQSQWDTMNPSQRISAVNIDIMNHKDFCTLSGFVMMGKVEFDDALPTAGTNGVDVFYGTEFLMQQNRKQLRFVQCHEALHKGLRHCVDYQDIVKKYGRLANVAMDYVVNALIEQTDPHHLFIEHPLWPEPLLDRKYYDRSFVDVLQDLLKESKDQPDTLDDHMTAPDDISEEELKQQVQDAFNHGDMIQRRLAGKEAKSNPLSGLGIDRNTDWVSHMREFIEQISTGDEHSRYNPPSRRFLPQGILMPTHFNVAMGELVIAGDTSASMDSVYPIIFGEVANICKQVNPERVRILWWDTSVRSSQTFERGQFDSLAHQLKPAGGGGTSPRCVVNFMEQHSIKPNAVIWLTDGQLDSCPKAVCSNELWGVVNNDSFKPAHGKVLRIHT